MSAQPILQVVICAWCPEAPALTARATANGVKVSHGLCPRCVAELANEPAD